MNRRDFRFPWGSGRTYVYHVGGGSRRRSRHLLFWFGKPKPRFTLSIILYDNRMNH